jgi:hypothetical protein
MTTEITLVPGALAIGASAVGTAVEEATAHGCDPSEVRRIVLWMYVLMAAAEDATIDELTAEFRSELEKERRARLAAQAAN